MAGKLLDYLNRELLRPVSNSRATKIMQCATINLFPVSKSGTKYFTGVFDGNDHTISNFTYTSTGTSYIALFGSVGSGGEIKDLGMVDVNVDAGSGYNVGGLVGRNYGTVSNCYATGSVTGGGWFKGGLVGYNYSGIISNCYTTGSVLGYSYVGGLVGINSSTVSNCYAVGDVNGIDHVGGLVGGGYGTVVNCFSSGAVSGSSNTGGLIGSGFGMGSTIYLCYWNTDTSGQIASAGGIGKTTAQMMNSATYRGWGYDAAWTIDEGNDYPRFVWENAPGVPIVDAPRSYGGGSNESDDPYQIATAEQLATIGWYRADFDKHFVLTADIDMTPYDQDNFNPIGNKTTKFIGVFDGNGHTIFNFTYASTGTSALSLIN